MQGPNFKLFEILNINNDLVFHYQSKAVDKK